MLIVTRVRTSSLGRTNVATNPMPLHGLEFRRAFIATCESQLEEGPMSCPYLPSSGGTFLFLHFFFFQCRSCDAISSYRKKPCSSGRIRGEAKVDGNQSNVSYRLLPCTVHRSGVERQRLFKLGCKHAVAKLRLCRIRRLFTFRGQLLGAFVLSGPLPPVVVAFRLPGLLSSSFLLLLS